MDRRRHTAARGPGCEIEDEGEAKANANDTPETALQAKPDITVRGAVSNRTVDDIDCFRVAG